ncbi:M56 family metallopeptidase [Paenibacillus sp. A3]|uniref:M56 family metallopeptidase n=1 Tax=Paenibacillus sp. A3 TaxID=1337054 RepID=UPI0006D5B5AA|nr:M56 family metallopeptidase [Paenibacillus sp. A3]
MDILCGIFLWFCYSTLAASAVALLVMAIQALFRRHMSARMRHALWLIVLIRLLLPDFPNSPLSLFNMLHLTSGMEKAVSEVLPSGADTPPIAAPENSQEKAPLSTQNYAPSQNNDLLPAAVAPQEAEKPAPSSTDRYPLALKIVSVVWLAGTVAILGYLLAYMWRIGGKRKTLQAVKDPRILSVMNDCRKKFGIRKPIPLLTGNEMKSPYISGVIHPWIYVPEALGSRLSDAQLYHLLSHELAHYKRKDIAWNMIGSFVLAVHWINPVIWICMKKMKADRELACDAYALEVLGEAEAIPYGMTIIEFLKLYSASRNQPSLLYFYGSDDRHQMIRRITMIKSFKKGTYKLSSIAVVCVAVMSVMTLTNAAEPGTADAPKQYAEHSAAVVKDGKLVPSSGQTFNTLEEAVKAADFTFKVPDGLPKGYRLEEARLSRKSAEESKWNEAQLRFVEGNKEAVSGTFDFLAVEGGAGLEATYETIEQSVLNNKAGGFSIGQGSLRMMKGLWAMKVTVKNSGQSERRYYVWEENGVQYQIEVTGSLSDQDIITIVSSMKYPEKA